MKWEEEEEEGRGWEVWEGVVAVEGGGRRRG